MLPEEKELENRQKRTYKTTICILTALILLPAITALLTSREAVIRNTEGKFYSIRLLASSGSYALCLKAVRIHITKKEALADKMNRGLAVISLSTVDTIEFKRNGELSKETQGTPMHWEGAYRINAAGHQGYLYLRQSKTGPMGTLRFPKWGAGANEHLRSLEIKGKTIRFVRSVTTDREMKRVGAPSMFVQRYRGEFSADGKSISGRFHRDGTEYSWTARRR